MAMQSEVRSVKSLMMSDARLQYGFYELKWARHILQDENLRENILATLELHGIRHTKHTDYGFFSYIIHPEGVDGTCIKIEMKAPYFDYDKPDMPEISKRGAVLFEDDKMQITRVPVIKKFLSEDELYLRKGEVLRMVKSLYDKGWFLFDIKPDNFYLVKDETGAERLVLNDGNALVRNANMHAELYGRKFSEVFLRSLKNLKDKNFQLEEPEIKDLLQPPPKLTQKPAGILFGKDLCMRKEVRGRERI